MATKRNPLEDLSKDELVVKCKALLAIAQKAKQAKTGKCLSAADLFDRIE